MTAKHWRLEHDGTFRETEPGRGTWVYHADHKRETAQLQARVAELEAALAAEREVHVSVSSASDDELTKTRDALRRLEVSANSVAYCYSKRPENFAGALQSLREDAAAAREVLGQ